MGYFIAFQNRKFHFGINTQGKTAISVIGKKGETLSQKLAIQVDFQVEEIMPDGKTRVKKILPETLESAQPATHKPQNIVIRGKVNGDASYEVEINEVGGMISMGGRLVDPGTLTKNPLRFSIRLTFPDAYSSAKASGNKKEEKEFKDKIKNDRLQLSWTNGKRVKQPTDEAVDAGSKELNGPGIAAMQVEFSSYEEKKFECTASENSSMTLSSTRSAPLHEGFSLTWLADTSKDLEGKARININVQ